MRNSPRHEPFLGFCTKACDHSPIYELEPLLGIIIVAGLIATIVIGFMTIHTC